MKDNMTLPEAFKIMIKNHVYQVPVVSHYDFTYAGMLDLMMICDYISTDIGLDVDENKLRDFLDKRDEFRDKTVNDVMDDTAEFVFQSYSLFHALEKMIKCRRRYLPVLSYEKAVRGIITQSMLIKFLYLNLSLLPKDVRETVDVDAIMPSQKVVTVREDMNVIDALDLLSVCDVQGIAVVNNNNILLDSISLSDLKGLSPDLVAFSYLWEPIKSFKKDLREKMNEDEERILSPQEVMEGRIDPSRITAPPIPARGKTIMVIPESNLEEIINTLETRRVHRLFVVDQIVRPHCLNVLSMSDVLKYVYDRFKAIEDVHEL